MNTMRIPSWFTVSAFSILQIYSMKETDTTYNIYNIHTRIYTSIFIYCRDQIEMMMRYTCRRSVRLYILYLCLQIYMCIEYMYPPQLSYASAGHT